MLCNRFGGDDNLLDGPNAEAKRNKDNIIKYKVAVLYLVYFIWQKSEKKNNLSKILTINNASI